MKRIFIFLSLLSLPALMQAQITQQQYSFVGKNMGTWCYPCGTWGWKLQEQIVQDNAGKAVVVELYATSAEQYLKSSTAVSLVGQFTPANSVPTWYVNGIDKTAYATNGNIYPTITETNVQNDVDSTYGLTALANSAFTSSITGDSLKVNAETEFFANTTGTYFLSIYLIEDGVVAYQNGIGNNAVHNHVLRAAASKGDFGNLIASGSINANAVYKSSFSTKLDNSWNKSKIWLAAVIWKRTGDINTGYKFSFVNTFSDFNTITSTSVKNISATSFKLNGLPNPLTENASFTVSTEKEVSNISVSLFDLSGRQLLNIFHGDLITGNHSFTIEPKNLPSGFYLLKVSSGKEQLVVKLIIQK